MFELIIKTDNEAFANEPKPMAHCLMSMATASVPMI
jgi:hypothetical protein